MKISELFYTKKDYEASDRELKPIKEYGGEEKFNVDVDGNIYQYSSWEDQEEDVTKKYHWIIPPGGQKVDLDWSPYETPSQQDIKLWVKLRMPARADLNINGPLNRDRLVKYARQKGLKI